MPRDIGDVSTIGEVTADYLVRIVDNPNSDYPVEKLIPGAELTPAAGGVPVADAGGYYTGTNVEAVLAELGAGIRSGPGGNSAIAIGDSTVIGSDAALEPQQGSWFSDLCRVSGQRLRYLRNAGVSGNTSSQMLARIATDVVAHSPDWCVLAGGTINDRAAGISLATSKANTVAMIAALSAAGIRTILATGCPHDTALDAARQMEYNAWVHLYGAQNRIPVLDVWSAVADPSDGTWLTAYTADGVHPSHPAGEQQIATHLSTRLSADLQYVEVLSSATGDPTNLVTNGVFVGDTNADGYANGWYFAGGTVASKSLEARTDPMGNWQLIECNGTLGIVWSDITPSFSVGDTLAFAVEYQKSVAATAVGISLNFNAGGSLRITLGVTGEAVDTTLIAYGQITVPASATTAYIQLTVDTAAGTVKFGRATIRNLTALGF